jgi:YVTN family beta-propeller protein
MQTTPDPSSAFALAVQAAAAAGQGLSPTGQNAQGVLANAIAGMLARQAAAPGGLPAPFPAAASPTLLPPPVLPVGDGPIGVAIAPNGAFAYVANNSGNSVTVIDNTTNPPTPSATITGFNGPVDVAITPNSAFAYVTNGSGSTVSVIDTASNSIIGLPIAVGANPFEIAITPNGTKAYVANHGTTTVSVIDLATNLAPTAITVGSSPNGVAVSPDGTSVYVSNSGSNTVSVIDTAGDTVSATVPVGSTPIGVAFTPDGLRAYVADNGSGTVSVIDTTTTPPSAGAPIPGFATPAGVAVNLDGSRVFVVNFGTNNVGVIDTALDTVIDTLPVGLQPSRNAVTPDGDFLYVTDNGSDDVTVLQIRPIIDSMTPPSGFTSGGEVITVHGSGFTGATAVTLDSTPLVFQVVDDNTLVIVAPPHAPGTVQASVTTPLGTGTGGSFTYFIEPPHIFSINPTSGTTSGGTLLVITGTGFTDAGDVSIGGTPVTSFQVIDNTLIAAITAPHGPGTGNVSVTTPGGTTPESMPYTYLTPVPTISGFTPTTGSTAGGTQITITGTGLTGTTAVSIAGVPAAGIQVLNDTTIVATTTPNAPTTGPITLTTPGGTATSAPNNYTYLTPAPTLTAIFPPTGPTGLSTQVSLSGTALTGTTSVTVDGTPVTYTVVSDNEITATLPPHTTGPVTVLVTTPGGSATITYTYTYTRDRSQLIASPALVRLFPPQPQLGILTATLTDLDTGQPIPGQTIAFTTGSFALGTATTNAQGVAVCNALLALTLIILNGGYTVSYAGNPGHQPTTAHGGIISA